MSQSNEYCVVALEMSVRWTKQKNVRSRLTQIRAYVSGWIEIFDLCNRNESEMSKHRQYCSSNENVIESANPPNGRNILVNDCLPFYYRLQMSLLDPHSFPLFSRCMASCERKWACCDVDVNGLAHWHFGAIEIIWPEIDLPFDA